MSENTKEIAQKAELKERIILSAMESFITHGIKTITMDDIAARLGISKRTLYETFKDKETLLVECIQLHSQERRNYVEQTLKESENVMEIILKCYKASIEDFQRTNKRFFLDLRKYPQVNELINRFDKESYDKTMQFFSIGIEQGFFRADINFPIVNLLVKEQINLLMNTDVCQAYSFIEVYESIMFTYMRGIVTEKGQKILEDFTQEYRQKTNRDNNNSFNRYEQNEK